MLGAIIGDICGSVYEKDNERDISKIVLFKEGCFPTDDTVMSIAVARAMMDAADLSKQQLKDSLVSSMHYYAHIFPKSNYGPAFRRWASSFNREPYNSFGNGSAMRVASVGWLFNSLEETMKYANISAVVTHDHPDGVKGAQVIAGCIYLARTGASKDEIREFAEVYYDLDFSLNDIRDDFKFVMTCQYTCPTAIVAFLESESFEDCIKKAISIGGDSDTIAAMAGAIAEGFYGIPVDMANKAIRVLTYCRKFGANAEYRVLRGVLADFEDRRDDSHLWFNRNVFRYEEVPKYE